MVMSHRCGLNIHGRGLEIDDNYDKKQLAHKEEQEGRFSYSAEIQKYLVCQVGSQRQTSLLFKKELKIHDIMRWSSLLHWQRY